MQRMHEGRPFQTTLLPTSSRSLPMGSSDNVPLFSPNQVSSQEEVLHSIFSPYAGPVKAGPITSDQNDVAPAEETHREIAPNGVPGVPRAATVQMPQSLPTTNSEIMSYGHSPYSVRGLPQYAHPSRFLNAVANCNSFESAVSGDNNAWFVLSTPTGGRQPMYFASPISEISALSDRSFKSFLGIPNIEMLSFDFVKQCTSQELLQKIISVLTKEDKFPGLLRAARQRWNTIGTDHEALPTPTASLPILPPKSQTWWMGWNSGQLNIQPNDVQVVNDSTLVMSLSDSSCLAGEGLSEKTEASPKNAAKDAPIASSTCNDAIVTSVKAPPTLANNTSPIGNGKTTVYKQAPESIYPTAFTQGPDPSSQAVQFSRLAKDKDESERHIRRLEEVASKSTNRTRELGLMVESLKKQNQQLLQRSKDDKAARDRAVKESNHTKDRFQRVLNELNDRLALATEQERQIQIIQKDKTELSNMLKDSMRQFATLKREQDAMILRLARAIKRKDLQIQNIDDKERKALVDEVAKKVSSGNATAMALTEAFESAEEDRRKAEQAFATSQAQLQKSISCQRRLERENQLLSQKIQQISDELARNSEQIEKLIQSSRAQQRKDWAAQEVHYQKVIQHLKQQLRSEESMVSTKLYEAQVKEVRKRESECYEKNRQIKSLSEKVANLEMKLKASVKVPPPPPPPPPTRPKPVLTVVTNTKTLIPPAFDKENAAPQKNIKNGSHTPVGLKQTTRSAIVQRAGGRKALMAQVKQMRSPKFANSGVF